MTTIQTYKPVTVCEWADESWGPNDGCREFMVEPERWECSEPGRWEITFDDGDDGFPMMVCARHAAQALVTDSDAIALRFEGSKKMTFVPMTDQAFDIGHRLGAAAAQDVVVDLDVAVARLILEDHGMTAEQNGEIETPTPLSGEWAGESVPELSARYGIDLEDEENANAFESAYQGAWWDVVLGGCRALVEGEQ